MRTTALLLAAWTVFASLAPAGAAESDLTLLRVFAAAAAAKEQLRSVPPEFAGMTLLSVFPAEAESLVSPGARDVLAALDRKEAYWGEQFTVVLAAKKRCDTDGASGLIVIPSLAEHARGCANLMRARQILELILEDVAKDKIYARLLIAGSAKPADQKDLLARKVATADKAARIAGN